MFARGVDDGLASFARRLDQIVSKNQEKKACGTVVLLADKKEDVAEKLEKVAKDQKLEHVPLTVCAEGTKGPSHYGINKNVNVTVVVYDDEKKVTATFAFDKLDAKSQDEALAAFAKVLGVEAPKSTAEKKDDKGSEKKDEKSEK